MKKLLISLVRDDQGQDLVEYALLVAGIALLAITGVQAFGGAINGWFNGLSARIPLT